MVKSGLEISFWEFNELYSFVNQACILFLRSFFDLYSAHVVADTLQPNNSIGGNTVTREPQEERDATTKSLVMALCALYRRKASLIMQKSGVIRDLHKHVLETGELTSVMLLTKKERRMIVAVLQRIPNEVEECYRVVRHFPESQ